MEKEEIDGDGIRVLQDALDSLPVKELYQQKMLTRIIAYYNDPARNGEEAMNEEEEPIFSGWTKNACPGWNGWGSAKR